MFAEVHTLESNGNDLSQRTKRLLIRCRSIRAANGFNSDALGIEIKITRIDFTFVREHGQWNGIIIMTLTLGSSESSIPDAEESRVTDGHLSEVNEK